MVIDTSNYYPGGSGCIEAIDNGLVEALWVAEQLGRPVAKAWSSVSAGSLATAGQPAGHPDRIALPVAADSDRELQVTMALVEDTGFDAVNAGALADSWRLQPGSPAHATDLPRDQLISALAAADQSLLSERRDLLVARSAQHITTIGVENLEPGYFVHLSRELYM